MVREVGIKMIKSMTGYGRCELEADARKVTIEMSSVNHRYCDMNIRMPKTLMQLEERIRKMIKAKISRGKVELNIYYTSMAEEDTLVVINEPVCKAYVDALRMVGTKRNLQDNIGIAELMKLSDVMSVQKKSVDLEGIWALIEEGLEIALTQLVAMREVEGSLLKADLLQKVAYVETVVGHIEKVAPQITKEYKLKLEERLSKLLGEVPVDESRIAIEVALFADKSCIDEEIIRLRSHLVQLVTILSDGDGIGRKLDFLMQEMNREANTIASKANHYDLTTYAVELKTEIEKMREQIQNIE